ncbi:FtsX-like permease family protein [Irregularibacter muris]|uniref:FtsX-like permease family protein n=1 Tax=Irregularibacter muris TaxID=1796619 RepID=UPI00214C3DE0|nr:ABC transporter permease [Irregularibacter muris]
MKVTIFLAVIALSLFILMFGSFVRNSQEMAEKTMGDYHTVIPVDLDSEKVNTLENNVNIKKLAYSGKKGMEKGLNNDFVFNVILGDKHYFETMNAALLDGELPNQENEILIPKWTAKDLNLKIGDSLDTVDEDNVKQHYKITGFMRYNTRSWEKEIPICTYMDSDTLKTNADHVIIWYKNIRDTYKRTPKLYESFGMDYEKALYEGGVDYNIFYLSSHFVNSDDGMVNASSEKYPQIFATGSILIGCFFIIVIKNIFMVWEKNHMREYGLLLSVGARKKDIVKLVIKRLMKIAIKPVFLGVISGMVLNFLMIKVVNKYYTLSQMNLSPENVNIFQFTISPLLILLILIISVLVILLASLGPVFKLSRVHPIDSMKLYRKDNTKYKKSYPLRGRNFIGDLSKINMKKDKKMTVVSTLAISLSLFILSALLALASGLDLDLTYNRPDELSYYNYKISYMSPKNMPEDLISELTNDFEEEYISYRKHDFYVEKSNDYENILDQTYLREMYPKYLEDSGYEEIGMDLVGIRSNRFEDIVESLDLEVKDFSNGSECIVVNTMPTDLTKPHSRLEYTNVIDESVNRLRVNVNPSFIDEKTEGFDLEVLAYSRDPNIVKTSLSKGLMALMPMEHFMSILSETDRNTAADVFFEETLYLKLPKDTSLEEIKSKTEEYLNMRDVEFFSRENLHAFESNSNRMLYSVIFMAAVFMAIVGLSSSYSATNSMNESRKQELVLLQIIGMDKSTLKKLIIREVHYNMIFIGITSIAFLLISAYIGTMAYKAFGVLEILLNMKIYLCLLYLLLIYAIFRRNYLKTLKEAELTTNSRIM